MKLIIRNEASKSIYDKDMKNAQRLNGNGSEKSNQLQ